MNVKKTSVVCMLATAAIGISTPAFAVTEDTRQVPVWTGESNLPPPGDTDSTDVTVGPFDRMTGPIDTLPAPSEATSEEGSPEADAGYALQPDNPPASGVDIPEGAESQVSSGGFLP